MVNAVPAVVCLSGGLDSTSLLLHLLARQRPVYGLSFDYGQKHRIELERLEANLQYLASAGHRVQWKCVDISDLSSLLPSALTSNDWEIPAGHYQSDNMRQTAVPNRNAIFVSIAYAWALSISHRSSSRVDVCLGVHAGDHTIYPDCRFEFYQAIFQAFYLGNWDASGVRMYLPYLDFDKSQILLDAQRSVQQLGLSFETVFRNTITSYSPDELGRSTRLTGSDVERILAFHKLGLVDPLDYDGGWECVLEQSLKFEADLRASQSQNSTPKTT